MATKKIKTIAERLDGKMWKAVQAMIDGLNEQSERKDFVINMSTFGYVDFYIDLTEKIPNKVCFGCAATCAVQKITKKNLTVESIGRHSYYDRAKALKLNPDDLIEFEAAINSLRLSDFYVLKKYFGINKLISTNPVKTLPVLTTSDWKENLPAYQKYADLLKEKDI